VVVPSQDSGFHQVAVEVAGLLGVLLAGAAGEEVALLVGLAEGTPVGAGLVGVEVPLGGEDGFAAEPEGCGVAGAKVGCGVPGVLLLELGVLGAELGVVLGALLGAVFEAALFTTAAEPAGHEVVELDGAAAFATVGITATPDAASTTAGSPIAVTMRARLVLAASTRRMASAASSGVGTTVRGLFTPPLRDRSGGSPAWSAWPAWPASDSGSGPASSANVPAAGADPARRARNRAASTASRWALASAADSPPRTSSGPEVFSFPLLLALALKT
jgi:hypothetical protein